MKPVVSRALPVVALVCFSACGPLVSSEPLNRPVRPMSSKDPSEVDLLTQPPSRPFVEVAALSIQASDWDWSSGTLFQKLRREGGRMGCDGVVVVSRSDGSEILRPSAPRQGWLATCVQYTDARPEPRVVTTTEGSIAPAPGVVAVKVDGTWRRVRAGTVAVACGRRRVEADGFPRVVDVPCGGTVTLD